ncbi:hypothetical protein Y032_0651g1149 [Ancylostoma ceylanicum]|uniref:Uncharacterized protein n=1 Tax=Ancylostoma ceylanicum TaxID=53326 RepID=A0A016WJY9_9BILA|nr:hypothetical protein Y032_0651g1149 [Ancylostoma ceylanicum]
MSREWAGRGNACSVHTLTVERAVIRNMFKTTVELCTGDDEVKKTAIWVSVQNPSLNNFRGDAFLSPFNSINAHSYCGDTHSFKCSTSKLCCSYVLLHGWSSRFERCIMGQTQDSSEPNSLETSVDGERQRRKLNKLLQKPQRQINRTLFKFVYSHTFF